MSPAPRPAELTLLLAAGPENAAAYSGPIAAALAAAGIAARLVPEAPPGAVDYIIYAPSDSLQDFAPFTRAKAVLSLWAGVERIVDNPTLTQPLCRMVDPALTATMVEWVVGHVMRHHLGMDRHIVNPGHLWAPTFQPLARERQVAVLGMGTLGTACAEALAAFGFQVTGWSRSPRPPSAITLRHGEEGLGTVLGRADIVVLLLPRTARTENLIDARRIAMMKPGAVLINPGRGALIEDAALLAALDAGHLSHATLDVFREEPLPRAHPFWAHPRVTVTPHVAASTRPDTSALVIAENIRRGEAGAPFLHLVDRARGY